MVSRWKKSVAGNPAAWARMKVRQWVPVPRGAGPRRVAVRMRRMVPAPIWSPRRVSSPWMRRCPQRGFSRARRMTSSRSSLSMRGRPGRLGEVQFLVIKRRCQARRVAGGGGGGGGRWGGGGGGGGGRGGGGGDE